MRTVAVASASGIRSFLVAMSARGTRSSRRLSDRAASSTAAESPSAVAPNTSHSKKSVSRKNVSKPSMAAAAAPSKISKREAEEELEVSLYGRLDAHVSASASAAGAADAERMPPPPATPSPAKRIRRSQKQDDQIPPPQQQQPPPPATPTPLRAKLMHQPASPAVTPRNKSKASKASKQAGEGPLTRPADPAATNAPLATPGGTSHTAYAASPSQQSPPPAYVPAPRTDTAHLLQKACTHLVTTDPRLQILIDAHPCPVWTPEALAEPVDPFRSLVSGILAQQVSGAAAASIRRKFVALFNEGVEDASTHHFPTPRQVVASDLATLRTAGLSGRKAEYVFGLAEKFESGELSAAMLLRSSWEEVLAKLTAVRGLGVWSVEMFGIFALKRMDILSTGDLGVQRGMAAFIGRDVKKLKAKGGGKWKYMTEKEMLDHSAKFAPYRSLFMYYMWRVEDVDISSMTDN